MANLYLIDQFSDKVKYFIASYTHFNNQTISIRERENRRLVSLQPHSATSSSTTTLTRIGVIDLGAYNHMMGGNSGLLSNFTTLIIPVMSLGQMAQPHTFLVWALLILAPLFCYLILHVPQFSLSPIY